MGTRERGETNTFAMNLDTCVSFWAVLDEWMHFLGVGGIPLFVDDVLCCVALADVGVNSYLSDRRVEWTWLEMENNL